MLDLNAPAALTRAVNRMIEEKEVAVLELRDIRTELAAGAMTATAALRMAGRLFRIERLLLTGER